MKKVIYIIVSVFLLSCNKNTGDIIIAEQVIKESSIQEKYSSLLSVPANEISNLYLYTFIDEWIGVKYKYGGMTKEGIACSGFCNILYTNVYNKELPRTSTDISSSLTEVGKEELEEGHLVVFNIGNKKNSHVGVYLRNNKFVHSSTSKGVIISSLNNPYYEKAYSKGGEV